MLKPYKEGRTYKPVKRKDGFYYTLDKEGEFWVVGSMKKYPQPKKTGGVEVEFDFIDACYFKNYKKAWVFFTGMLKREKLKCYNPI